MDRVAWFIDPSLCGIVAVGAASLFYLSNKRKGAAALESAPTSKRIAFSDDTKVDSKKYSVGDPHPYELKPEFKGCVYMDYNATTPVFPEVTAVMLPFLTTCFGNPSSSHIFSTPCRDALKQARNQVGALINTKDPTNEIYFTSCGTESDNRAIDIAIHHFTQHKMKNGIDMNNILPHVISCKTEHPAVICYLRVLVLEQRIRMTVLPVDSEGFINLADLKKALTPHTALVTIMHSNNEVGTIQPIREITQCVKHYNSKMNACVLVHSDAAQSLGKVLVDVQHLETDLVTIVGHKFGAPKGVAALYMRTGIDAPQMLVGGGQERGLRSGTENVALVAGLGEASRLALAESGALLLHLLALKHRLVSALLQGFTAEKAKLRFNGPTRACSPKDLLSELKVMRVMIKSDSKNNLNGGSLHTALRGAMTLDVLQQLPNTVSVSFQGIRSYEIIAALSEKVACSAGSACHAVHTTSVASNATTESNPPVEVKMSDVLAAMGVPEDFGFGTLRLSFGRHTTERDIDIAVEHIVTAIKTAWKE